MSQVVGIVNEVIPQKIRNENTLDLVEVIPHLVEKAQSKKGSFFCKTVQELEKNGRFFYAFHRDQQIVSPILDEMSQKKYLEATKKTTMHYQDIKLHILQKMGLDPETKIVKVVGDSTTYSLTGTEKAKKFLNKYVTSDVVMLYGYTGHAEQDGTRCVNAAATDHIKKNEMVNQTIGNLVGFHTPTALKSWGCTGPDLKYNILVYGDDETKRETGTVFGDDIVTSDFLADKLVVLEGGIPQYEKIASRVIDLENKADEEVVKELWQVINLDNSFALPLGENRMVKL